MHQPAGYKNKAGRRPHRTMDRRQYRLDIRPDLWWNPIDGIKAGVHFEGDYLFTLCKIDGTVWWNTHALQENIYMAGDGASGYTHYAPVNYSFNFISPVMRSMPKLQLILNSRYLDGLWYHKGGLDWLVNGSNDVQVYAQTMWRPNSYDLDYLIAPQDWSSTTAQPNSSINAEWQHHYNYQNGNGRYTFSFRAPLLTNAFDYS